MNIDPFPKYAECLAGSRPDSSKESVWLKFRSVVTGGALIESTVRSKKGECNNTNNF